MGSTTGKRRRQKAPSVSPTWTTDVPDQGDRPGLAYIAEGVSWERVPLETDLVWARASESGFGAFVDLDTPGVAFVRFGFQVAAAAFPAS
jgi:hypothetical protein